MADLWWGQWYLCRSVSWCCRRGHIMSYIVTVTGSLSLPVRSYSDLLNFFMWKHVIIASHLMSKFRHCFHHTLFHTKPLLFATTNLQKFHTNIAFHSWPNDLWPLTPFVRPPGLDWDEKAKSGAPLGQLPILEFHGQKFCQSSAIARFLAAKFNLMGDDEMQVSAEWGFMSNSFEILSSHKKWVRNQK